MIDFHSHVLPQIDDGSRSVEESLKMVEWSSAQGVSILAATPHFYPGQDNPERFLRHRNEAADRLADYWKSDFPTLLLGAEVYYYSGIHMTDALHKLRLSGTPFLMIEMPFTPWSRRMVDEILQLNEEPDTQIVLAHIDRYLSMQPANLIEELAAEGIQMQANAESFLNWRRRRKILQMLEYGNIQFLGSDCHNLTSRPPCLDQASTVIKKKFGEPFWEKFTLEGRRRLMTTSEAVL